MVHLVESVGVHRAAMITAFDTNGAAFLTIFYNDHQGQTEAQQDEATKAVGTYHMPE